MAKNEIEVFEYLEARASINGLNVNDLQNLLLMPGPYKEYKHLKVRIINNDFILLHDKSKGKNVYLGCVGDYHNLGEKDCYRIRRKIGTYNDNQDDEQCVKCHLKCIEMLKNGTL